MDKQYKLFKIFDYEKTTRLLADLFNDDELWKINEKLIAVAYDYNMNKYKSILNKVRDLNMSQKIITSRSFMSILKICIEKQYFIRKVEFIESVPKEIYEFINNNINELNSMKGYQEREVIKRNVIEELNWLRTNDGVDINLISFRIKDEEGLKVTVSFYNNGVISINRDSILEDIAQIINKIP